MPAEGSASEIHIPVEVGRLEGSLFLPDAPRGLVLFAHGSGSSRTSPRNRYVAAQLHTRGIGTLLFDLLTPVEDSLYRNRFDIELLSRRLLQATDWVLSARQVAKLPLGYFGASTGAAAALRAAAERGDQVRAVVSRGGRPDLAGPQALEQVVSPTLLLVGGRDTTVLALNRDAHAQLNCTKQMRVIPGAGHLFEEPGALEQVSQEAADWFERHFGLAAAAGSPAG